MHKLRHTERQRPECQRDTDFSSSENESERLQPAAKVAQKRRKVFAFRRLLRTVCCIDRPELLAELQLQVLDLRAVGSRGCPTSKPSARIHSTVAASTWSLRSAQRRCFDQPLLALLDALS
ncbi:MAG: hypothetical protein ACLU9X_03355 [Alistipes shahii]